jgi:hypothetical protein
MPFVFACSDMPAVYSLASSGAKEPQTCACVCAFIHDMRIAVGSHRPSRTTNNQFLFDTEFEAINTGLHRKAFAFRGTPCGSAVIPALLSAATRCRSYLEAEIRFLELVSTGSRNDARDDGSSTRCQRPLRQSGPASNDALLPARSSRQQATAEGLRTGPRKTAGGINQSSCARASARNHRGPKPAREAEDWQAYSQRQGNGKITSWLVNYIVKISLFT